MGTVILADKLTISHAGWLYFLQTCSNISNILDATGKSDLAALMPSHPSCTVIVDYANFDFTGVEDLINMVYRYPSSHWIIFSEDLSADFVKQMCHQTINTSILFRDASKNDILSALSKAFNNERYLSPSAGILLTENHATHAGSIEHVLTPSEREILRSIALGKSTKEIAMERFSSIHTITTHRKNIFRKLEVNSVYEATRYALRAGIIDAAEYYI